MKAGVVYPQVELGGDPGAVKAFAQAADGKHASGGMPDYLDRLGSRPSGP